MDKAVYSKNEPSLAYGDGGRTGAPSSERTEEIDEHQNSPTTSFSTAEKRTLLRNEFTTTQSLAEVTNQDLEGKPVEQARKEKTIYVPHSSQENANQDTGAPVDDKYLENITFNHRNAADGNVYRKGYVHPNSGDSTSESFPGLEARKEDDRAVTSTKTYKTVGRRQDLTLLKSRIPEKQDINEDTPQMDASGTFTNVPSVPYTTSENENIIQLKDEEEDDVNKTQSASSRNHRHTTTAAPIAITNNRNIRAREEGDAIIGALFPLHRAPTQRSAYTRQCGEIWENYGIQRVETFLMTIDRINR